MAAEVKIYKQYLPVESTCIVNNFVIKLEVCKTPEQIIIGMSNRDFLSENHGMLFNHVVEGIAPQYYIIMRNTIVPMDVIFIKEKKIIDLFENCTPNDGKIYYPRSEEKFDSVLELPDKSIKKFNLKINDDVSFQPETIDVIS